MKLRQSTIADFLEYKKSALCGLVLEAKIAGTLKTEDTDAQNAGWWFEDLLVRGETSRVPVQLKKGDFAANYRYLQAHLEVGKKMLDALPKPYTAGVTLERGVLQGTPDIITMDGRVIDIKTTAHLHQKWEEYGWGALDDPHKGYYYDKQLQRRRLQGLAYCYLSRALDPIYTPCNTVEFWVFSTTSDDVKVFRLKFASQEVEAFEDELNAYNTEIQTEILIGFTPAPKYQRCKACPLNATCASKASLPDVVDVYGVD